MMPNKPQYNIDSTISRRNFLVWSGFVVGIFPRTSRVAVLPDRLTHKATRLPAGQFPGDVRLLIDFEDSDIPDVTEQLRRQHDQGELRRILIPILNLGISTSTTVVVELYNLKTPPWAA